MTCWDKRAYFRLQKSLFLGLAVAALAEHFSRFLGNDFHVVGKNIALSPRFGSILVYLFAHNPSLHMIN